MLVPFLPKITEKYEKILSQSAEIESTAPVFFSNGFNSPEKNFVVEILKIKYGAKVICFQHGAIGLIKTYRTTQKMSDMAQSDGFVCYNQYEPKYFKKHVDTVKPEFFVNGGWPSVEAPFPSIARSIIRKHWDISSNQNLVLYAPTRFKEGHLWLLYDFRDMDYWWHMRSVIMNAMGGSNAQCIVKVHQKGLNTKDMKKAAERLLYMKRESPLSFFDLPGNVRVENYPDLTYSRHAADIIIIDRGTSTLGWALSSKAIVVFLDTKTFGLEDEILSLMQESLFLYDINHEGWQEELRNLIDMDTNKRNQIWNKKKPARKHLMENYILGPKTPPGSFDDFVTGFFNNSR